MMILSLRQQSVLLVYCGIVLLYLAARMLKHRKSQLPFNCSGTSSLHTEAVAGLEAAATATTEPLLAAVTRQPIAGRQRLKGEGEDSSVLQALKLISHMLQVRLEVAGLNCTHATCPPGAIHLRTMCTTYITCVTTCTTRVTMWIPTLANHVTMCITHVTTCTTPITHVTMCVPHMAPVTTGVRTISCYASGTGTSCLQPVPVSDP